MTRATPTRRHSWASWSRRSGSTHGAGTPCSSGTGSSAATSSKNTSRPRRQPRHLLRPVVRPARRRAEHRRVQPDPGHRHALDRMDSSLTINSIVLFGRSRDRRIRSSDAPLSPTAPATASPRTLLPCSASTSRQAAVGDAKRLSAIEKLDVRCRCSSAPGVGPRDHLGHLLDARSTATVIGCRARRPRRVTAATAMSGRIVKLSGYRMASPVAGRRGCSRTLGRRRNRADHLGAEPGARQSQVTPSMACWPGPGIARRSPLAR